MRTKLFYLLILLGIGLLLYFAFRPSAVIVETANIVVGPLQVTIDEEGETRAHDRFIIAAPVSGKLNRIELHEGDEVQKNDALAFLNPLPLDLKQRQEVIARLQAAESLKKEADQYAEHAQADYEQAKRERIRIEKLTKDGFASQQSLEQAKNAEVTTANESAAARHRVRALTSEVEIAKAGMIALEEDSNKMITLHSPVDGRVLRVLEKSERVVTAGTDLLIVGDKKNLEIVIDLLSTDAVKVKPGDEVVLENWGGEQTLKARVKVVEPFAFTKVSALGIEEQRVNIVADFIDPPESLGDGYRVDGRIIVWKKDRVLKAPSNALFRRGDTWSVFTVKDGVAQMRDVKVGHRNPLETEILLGLDEGEQVILHPSNDIEDGIRVQNRK
ncbi:MAG TPA: efflux RND transporter periplasmic adaptor subunit [Acidobacteriota bacterium]|nr:efflux RND transporter periplasmic adaptor subunit [Acidobacteriota bacterium]